MRGKTKKILKWTVIVLLSPLLLMLLLTLLLYLPPVQNWAVKQVAAYASEQTGMQISVGHVDIGFPLDIGADNVLVVQDGDTVADIGRVVALVKFWPLLERKVELGRLELNQATINTRQFIEDMRVKGRFDQLAFKSRYIDLDKEVFQMNDAHLKHADLAIMLSDTAVIDTTDIIQWKIKFDRLAVEHSTFTILIDSAASFAQPATTIVAYMGQAEATGGQIDLAVSCYDIKHLDWGDGRLSYDSLFATNDMHLVIDDLHSKTPLTGLDLKSGRLKEQVTGLEITRAQGPVTLDAEGIRMPGFALSTPYSTLHLKVDVDYSALDDSIPMPGHLDVDLEATIGKQDLLRFMADMPEAFGELWPDEALRIKGQLKGNVQQADIPLIEIDLPGALHAGASGTVANMTDADNIMASLDWQAEAGRLHFLPAVVPDYGKAYNLPQGLSMTGHVDIDGPVYKAYASINDGHGRAFLKGGIDMQTMAYSADIKADSLNISRLLPDLSLYSLTADARIEGQGIDFTSTASRLKADISLRHLRYGDTDIDNISGNAQLTDGHALATLTGHNRLLNGRIDIDALLGSGTRYEVRGTRYEDSYNISASIKADLNSLDLQALGLADQQLANIRGQIDLEANQQVTRADVHSGDLTMKLEAAGGYERLADQLSVLADSLAVQFSRHTIDQTMLKSMLPTMHLTLSGGRSNVLADILRASAGIDFKDLNIDMNTSPETGLNGNAHLYALRMDSTRIDTIRLSLKDTPTGLSYQGQVTNNKRNPQIVFNALLDGRIYDQGASTGLRVYDADGKMGLRIGAYIAIEDNGLRFRLVPERPTLGYKQFALNSDNFLFIRDDSRLQAKIDLIADDGTGIKIYSSESNPDLLQDLTVSLNRFDLEQLTDIIPYFPRISGTLNGDYHLMMNDQRQVSMASDMEIRNMAYEGSRMGNIATEFVYLQREDDTHAIEGVLMRDGNEIGSLRGEIGTRYEDNGGTEVRGSEDSYLNAELQLIRMPLDIVNGFIPDQLFGFDGYAEGALTINGRLSQPDVDGEIFLDSAHLISQPYSIRLRFDNDPVRIIDSKLLLENFTMYAYNDNPLNIMGELDFSNIDRMKVDMRMRARDFQLINAKRTAQSIAYGKMFVNFYADMKGTTDKLKMRGRLDILGTTDLRYILLDSPLSTDSQLDELVKFTDFTDTTKTVVERPVPDGLDIDLTISIDQGAHARCDLNAEQTNHVDLFGGGDLRMRYNADGINLTGRYTVNSGSMKYSLPVIPLTTFTIQDGSYVEFTGDPTNPTLNLTATERKRATVGQEGEQSRNVAFDCGVVVTKTLNDMGLEFIISAPEDMTVDNDLQTMGAEQRGKLAVTMLTTGMYLADGNTSGFSMNSALSSFLENEINNITGSALSTLDLTIGLDNTTDASGQSHTNYSFKFAKRFWNNRLKVQIGGLVSTGNEAQGQNQSFFDNVTMEYRLSPTANQYVKLFYNQNAYDWIEGYTSEYGGGFIWKRKLEHFMDIFRFSTSQKNKEERIMPADSIGRKEGPAK